MTGIITLDGVIYTLTLVNDADYTPNVNDQIIVYTAITTTRNVVLTNLNVGQRLEVWDGTAAGSAAAHNLNFNVSGAVKVNATTSGSITAVNIPNGYATAVQTAANTWVAQGSPLPATLPFGAPQITIANQIKWTETQTYQVGSTAAATITNGGAQFNSNTQTISGTLTLAVGSPVYQILTASGGDQIVTESNTGGVLRYVANVGGANNLLVQLSSVTKATVTPGHSIFYYVNNTGQHLQHYSHNLNASGHVFRSVHPGDYGRLPATGLDRALRRAHGFSRFERSQRGCRLGPLPRPEPDRYVRAGGSPNRRQHARVDAQRRHGRGGRGCPHPRHGDVQPVRWIKNFLAHRLPWVSRKRLQRAELDRDQVILELVSARALLDRPK